MSPRDPGSTVVSAGGPNVQSGVRGLPAGAPRRRSVFVPFDESTLPLAGGGTDVELVPFSREYVCFRAFRVIERGGCAGASRCLPLVPDFGSELLGVTS